MATEDVPGANPKNSDELKPGCWSEHEDGSLIFVKGNEAGTVIFEIYDLSKDRVFYQDAMLEAAFKTAFSHPPTGTSKEKWTWHDKTPFPWSRVMKTFERPAPQDADVLDTLSAAQRVAESLRMRAKVLEERDIEQHTDQVRSKGKSVLDRIVAVLDAFRN